MKKILALLLAMVLALSVCACAKTQPTESEDQTESGSVTEPSSEEPTIDPNGTHDVTDHKGNVVTVKNTIDRIVVCDIYPLPSILTVFFDSAEKIVGMGAPSMAAAKNSLLSKLYPEILNAETGFIDGSTINVEELIKLEPDIVFYNAGKPEEEEAIKNAGLTGIAISAGKWKYNAFETLEGWIDTLDQIFPSNEKTAKVKEYADKVYEEVTGKVASLSDEEKEDVFFLFQYTGESLLSAGNPSFGSWWAEAIGAKFVLTETTEQNSLPATMEQIYQWDPSVIFITNFTTAKTDDLLNNTIGTYDWSPVSAVKEKRVYKMPLGMYRSYTAGVDAPIALLWLAKATYPELFKDVDITERTVSYYKDVFGITLTDEQANSIFDPDPAAGVMK